ncbi:MAG: hypothetical protein ACQEQV_05430 [Fibrobacterota bacterium]
MAGKKIFLLILLLSFSLVAFETKMDYLSREELLVQVDSLSLEIQNLRRRGEPIDHTEEELDKVRWALEQYKTGPVPDTLAVAQEQSPSDDDSRINPFLRFFTENSSIDLLIMISGGVAFLAVLFLIVLQVYLALRRRRRAASLRPSRQGKKRNIHTKPAQKKEDASPAGKKDLTYRRERELREGIEALRALQASKDPAPPDDSRNPFSHTPSAGASPSLREDVLSTPGKRSESAKSTSLPRAESGHTAPAGRPEKAAHPRSRAETAKPSAGEQEQSPPVGSPGAVIAASRRGEDVRTIARTQGLSMDQVTLILKVSGR